MKRMKWSKAPIKIRGTGTSVRCEEKWNISATDERKWNPIFASEAFLESKVM